LTTIAFFLFTRRLQQYAILRIKPVRTEFHFSALPHGDYVLWAAELWFVVVCGALNRVRQKISQTYIGTGIVLTKIHDNLATTTIHLVFFMSWIVAYAA